MKIFSAIDLGYGHCKGKRGNVEISIPSVTGQKRKLIDSIQKRDPLQNIIDNKRNEFIGDLALRQSSTKKFSLKDEKVNQDSTKALLEVMLGLLTPNYTQFTQVITGLPVTFYFQQKQDMENLIIGEHDVDIKVGDESIQRIIDVTDVRVIPQPMGSALNFILDDDGYIKESVKDIAKGRIGVLDIGFFTNDLLVLEGLEINQDLSRSLRSGLSVAYKAMNDAGIDLPIYELDKKVRNGSFEHAKNKAFKALAQQIQGEVETYWRDIDLIIVTGGGGAALYQLLDLPCDFILSEDATMSNVHGYYKMGRRSWG